MFINVYAFDQFIPLIQKIIVFGKSDDLKSFVQTKSSDSLSSLTCSCLFHIIPFNYINIYIYIYIYILTSLMDCDGSYYILLFQCHLRYIYKDA